MFKVERVCENCIHASGGSVPNRTHDQERGALSRTEMDQEDTHFRILRLLEGNSIYTQRQMAEEVGISLGALNYCLRALVGKGLIKIENFRRAERKLPYAYLLTPQGVAAKVALTTRFLNRKIREYADLRNEIESLQQDAERLNRDNNESR